MSKQSNAFARQTEISIIKAINDGAQEQQQELQANLEKHPNYQALIDDSEYQRLDKAWKDLIQKQAAHRKKLWGGMYYADLSPEEQDTERRLYHKELSEQRVILHEICKLKNDYQIPLAIESINKALTPDPATLAEFAEWLKTKHDQLKRLCELLYMVGRQYVDDPLPTREDTDELRRAIDLAASLRVADRPAYPVKDSSVTINDQTAAIDHLRRSVDKLLANIGAPVAMGTDDRPDPVAPKPDGPEAPKRFWHGGKPTDLQPLPWKLLDYLWHNRTAKVVAVERHVWGDDAETDSRLKSTINRVNEALLSANSGMQIRKSGEWLKLE